jgi:GNAT superfamily N-acetyltransferase
MLLRRARDEDAPAAAELLRRSIAAHCAEEYRHDPEVLARWLANKTPETLRRWIAGEDRAVVLACQAEGPRRGRHGRWRGEIALNYVAPEARFRGASKALLAHMEDHLRARGVAEAELLSTQLARRSTDRSATGRTARSRACLAPCPSCA